jgi:hypothetical protein
MEADHAVIRAQLSSLKRRVKSQRSSGAFQLAEGKQEEPSHPVGADFIEPAVDKPEHVPSGERPLQVAAERADTTYGSSSSRLPASVSSQSVAPVTIIKWACTECSNECIPIMRESRCLCGHRMKEHKSNPRNPLAFPCASKSCKCAHFFYLVAEGAWILRCRCKHKHTDHDCGPGAHKCSKCAACSGFDSPWVCNCGHTWASHQQQSVTITEESMTKEDGEPANLQKKQHFYRQDGLDGL